MNELLEFSNVSYWYKQGGRQQTILQKVHASFDKGNFYSVIGPSGSGKTTFLSLASGLDVPKEGKILYNGKDIQDIGLSNFRNKFVSIVFQSYNLLPYMTAMQNIITAMEITGSKVKKKKEFVLEMLNKVGINEKQANQRVLTLSGGQQQRISIARALCCQSDFIVADEPTGNLDEDTAQEIVQLFKELAHKENKCIIVVTHNNEIAATSDVIVKINRGKFEVRKNDITIMA
ncbi:ABC transporter ATP-binding protein [Sutcliffiella sp. NPDC057660]|uniref:ABC transporter ATP-binding protein n=1 Tax=Sutcliffiella sp. NPDC057660 TaxID=3346199 RepID=UPI0036CC66B4